MKRIVLDFGTFSISGTLNDSEVAQRFWDGLPAEIDLERWGNELYGRLDFDCGTVAAQNEIPAGGIAYSKKGRYLCFFFGQTPAWPVDLIGMMEDWGRLRHERPSAVTVRRV